MTQSNQDAKNYKIEDYSINEEPFTYLHLTKIKVFESAYNQKVPVLLKGPTGRRKQDLLSICLGISLKKEKKSVPLVTVACHEDLTASDLVGRYLIDASGTKVGLMGL